jgi:broad specificity phosphatase PhoE
MTSSDKDRRIEDQIGLLQRSFLFVRHGETDWNRENRCLGQTDRPLTEYGRRQAENARSLLIPAALDRIFHSPLIRAVETAKIISSGTSCKLVMIPGLTEVRFGDKEGLVENDPADDFVTYWFRGGEIPNSEPYLIFRKRVVTAIESCLSEVTDKTPLIVAHGGVYAALTDYLGHGIAEIDHCAVHRFSPSPQGWRIEPYG